MVQVAEAAKGDNSQLAAALQNGLETLDLNQEIPFRVYTRVVLPIDGYVFWAPGAIKTFKGSLHHSIEMRQEEDETYGQAQAIFTSESPIVEFTEAPANEIYVSTRYGFRFAFSRQGGFYDQAKLWHYVGPSIPPAMLTQLLDDPNQLDENQAVVSNSLPLWLMLNTYTAPWYDGFSNSLTLYPSYLVSTNLQAPYGVVHIGEEDTRAIQSIPYLDKNRSHWQLAADRVRITLYGLQNDAALDFMDTVLQFLRTANVMGLMNTPIMTDSKRTMPETQSIGMRKVITFETSYYQSRVNDIARQLIKSALPTVVINDA